jgi:hypothetical protein
MIESTVLEKVIRLPGFERLQAAILDAETRLADLKGRGIDDSKLSSCSALLDSAKRAATSRLGVFATPRHSLAWDALQQFDREIMQFLTDAELAALWISLKAEAERKLDGWHKDAATKLVESAGAAIPPRETVRELMHHIHVNSQNLYHKIDRLRAQLLWVAFLLVVVIAALLTAAVSGRLSWLSTGLRRTLPAGTLAGILGGVLSMAYSMTRSDPAQRIPETRSSFLMATIRPLVGAAVALPIIAAFESGLINVSGAGPKDWVMLAFCFVGGFSERWFLGLVENLEGKKT